ncbi:MAG: YSC84-related protein [Deferrisomatales bacterium]|nr:YSC84-related protein [Deferrisomatales bacterium]
MDRPTRRIHALPALLLVLALTAGMAAPPAHAATAEEIDVSVDVALKNFRENVNGAERYLEIAKGLLVFPKVVKAGMVVGGEYGEGALRIGGRTAGYYNTAAASFGFQLGAQVKTVMLVFLEADALNAFRASDGWEVGVDGSVALVTVGAGGTLDTTQLKQPIVAFVYGQKGLMYNLTLEGSKYSKLKK